jgi:hypothetical protein
MKRMFTNTSTVDSKILAFILGQSPTVSLMSIWIAPKHERWRRICCRLPGPYLVVQATRAPTTSTW